MTEISRNGFFCASEHQGESVAGQHGIKFFPCTEINPKPEGFLHAQGDMMGVLAASELKGVFQFQQVSHASVRESPN
ncbi:hypothetical protein [Sulfitobacter sp. EhC04]|uniref:hypothetical protein n=1 Tax=Sulfitobacter sp. EhC04 TaxID=1849168 RepID=UPI0013731448|nr:hypothetical protein [Sulfitobacter sp. EhC04]